MHELLELFIQSKLGDTDSTRDVEEYERESKTIIFAGTPFALLALLCWSVTAKVRFE